MFEQQKLARDILKKHSLLRKGYFPTFREFTENQPMSESLGALRFLLAVSILADEDICRLTVANTSILEPVLLLEDFSMLAEKVMGKQEKSDTIDDVP